ncbi:gel scht [Duganella sp. FT80W]|uniref:Gel scht n=1 Tax=Duganella guangzhouensis TaxID=2666084 RepID=A0A6I2L5P9_9BURK|nr:gel scht [Duganella guangzhouensis]MRW92537.1 gel scht [Duganella guangzhouensis]
MKSILLGVVAALALTSLPAVHAEDSSVSIQAPRIARYYMDPVEFRTYSNTYQLENGQTINFRQRMTMMYTQLEDGRSVRIYAVSPKAFVTETGVRIEFRDEGETVAITDFQKLPMAKVQGSGTIVMAAARQQ